MAAVELKSYVFWDNFILDSSKLSAAASKISTGEPRVSSRT